jgi:hypothetical protein
MTDSKEPRFQAPGLCATTVLAIACLAATPEAEQPSFRSGVDDVAVDVQVVDAQRRPLEHLAADRRNDGSRRRAAEIMASGRQIQSLLADAKATVVAGLLSSAASYVGRFTAAFGHVIAEERYVQTLLPGGRLMAGNAGAAAGVRQRQLRSDLVLVPTGDVLGWQMFRDVFEVDGAPVRDRQERLSRLFAEPSASALDQAARIVREGARYNIGAVERTVNTPVLTLLFLQADHQRRFAFAASMQTAGFSDRVDVLGFQEVSRPTIIRTVGDSDRPAGGRIWIDRETGEVLQTELLLSGEGLSIRFTTLFRHDDRLNVAVPARMEEEYVFAGAKLVGTATYGSFRHFSVKTETNLPVPERPIR